MRLYTWGYDARSLDDLLALMQRYGINLVADVRHRRRAADPQWSAASLRQHLGERYVWARELGNVAAVSPGQPVDLVDWAAGLERLHSYLRQHGTVLLLCADQRPADCHRQRIAAMMQQRIWELQVTHL